MQIVIEHPFKTSVEQLYRLFLDPSFNHAKFLAEGARNIQQSLHTAADGSVVLAVQRDIEVQPPSEIPYLLKKFIRPCYSGVQTEHWQGSAGGPYHCALSIEISGVPVSILGALSLKAKGRGCVISGHLDIDCGLPLVGKKLAAFIATDVQSKIALEDQFTRAYLAQL